MKREIYHQIEKVREDYANLSKFLEATSADGETTVTFEDNVESYPRPDIEYDSSYGSRGVILESLRTIARQVGSGEVKEGAYAIGVECEEWTVEDFHGLQITYAETMEANRESVVVEVEDTQVYERWRRPLDNVDGHDYHGGLRYVGDWLEDFEYVIEETEAAIKEYGGGAE